MAKQRLSIKAKALRLLAQREYSRAELEGKLLGWLHRQAQQAKMDVESESVNTGDAEDRTQEAQRILDAFQTRGWVSDERVAESVLRQKAHRLGASRLQQELRTKGLDEQLVQDALKNISDSEFERACTVWQRKFDALPTNVEDYNKQMRFLMYRGFTGDVVRKVLSGKFLEK